MTLGKVLADVEGFGPGEHPSGRLHVLLRDVKTVLSACPLTKEIASAWPPWIRMGYAPIKHHLVKHPNGFLRWKAFAALDSSGPVLTLMLYEEALHDVYAGRSLPYVTAGTGDQSADRPGALATV